MANHQHFNAHMRHFSDELIGDQHRQRRAADAVRDAGLRDSRSILLRFVRIAATYGLESAVAAALGSDSRRCSSHLGRSLLGFGLALVGTLLITWSDEIDALPIDAARQRDSGADEDSTD